jgi:hypothetical protein
LLIKVPFAGFGSSALNTLISATLLAYLSLANAVVLAPLPISKAIGLRLCLID